MNYYCTYFDSRYAAQGLALWLSLRQYDPSAVLWVLALDDATVALLRGLAEPDLRVVTLVQLEEADSALPAARLNRTWIEYVFTLSPCLPRFLLAAHPEIGVLTYVDADMAFFSAPGPILDELGDGNLLIVSHRFPGFLRPAESRGRFNVGVLCYRNSVEGRRALDWWRERCLEWCHDRVEPGRYADQKYLDTWPELFRGVVICQHAGVNLAPWNWIGHHYRFAPDRLMVDGRPLIVFHFARFRSLSRRRFDSGQLEYGIMPLRLRSWLYGRYFGLLEEARRRITPIAPDLAAPRGVARGARAAWKSRLLAWVFGPIWLRVGPFWISGRLGLGRFSGRIVAKLRWWRQNRKQ